MPDQDALPTTMHACDNCGATWPSKFAAAECCDPAWERGED